MKSILIAFLAFVMTTSAMATDFGFGKTSSPKSFSPSHSTGMYTVDEGNMVFSLGYGAPNLSKSLFSIYESYTDFTMKSMGPLHLKFEYFLSDRFGVGLVANYVSNNVSYKYDDGTGTIYTDSYDYSSLAFNVRFNWHFYNQNGFDFYAGSGVGYKITNRVYTSDNPLSTDDLSIPGFPLGFEVTAGGRYFITDMIGVYAEVGAAKSVIQGGIVVKL